MKGGLASRFHFFFGAAFFLGLAFATPFFFVAAGFLVASFLGAGFLVAGFFTPDFLGLLVTAFAFLDDFAFGAALGFFTRGLGAGRSGSSRNLSGTTMARPGMGAEK
jgi:hypothetical protein